MTNQLNFVVWAETCEDGASVAKLLTGSNTENSCCFFKGTVGTSTVNVYLRGPKCSSTTAPSNGVTDVLVLYLTTSDFLESASDYVGQRRGIPTKFVVSTNDHSSWAAERSLTYQAVLDQDFATKLVSTAESVNATIVKTFNLFDKDGNGFISVDELLTVSKELGHELNTEEAKEISNTISTDSKISYDRFKHWWFLGRNNFGQFRALVEMEMKVNNLIKQNSQAIGGYLESLAKDVSEQSLESNLISRLNIKPKVDFENGVGVTLNYSIGKQGKEIISGLPDYHSSNPLTYSFEFQIDDAEKGPVVVSQLEGVRDMVMSMIPQVGQAYEMGVLIKFRHVGTSVLVEISLGGQIGEMINAQLSQFTELLGSGLNGFGSSQVFSGLKLNNPLETSFEDFVKMATQFKVSGHGEISSLKPLIEFLEAMVTMQGGNHMPKQLKLGFKVFKVLSSLRNFNYDCEYDSDEMCTLIKELAGKIGHNTMGQAPMTELNSEIGVQILGGVVAQFQETGKMQLEGVKGMAGMFLGPYMEALTTLNLDKIGVGLSIPGFGLHYKLSLQLAGLTEFLRTNIFSG